VKDLDTCWVSNAENHETCLKISFLDIVREETKTLHEAVYNVLTVMIWLMHHTNNISIDNSLTRVNIINPQSKVVEMKRREEYILGDSYNTQIQKKYSMTQSCL